MIEYKELAEKVAEQLAEMMSVKNLSNDVEVRCLDDNGKERYALFIVCAPGVESGMFAEQLMDPYNDLGLQGCSEWAYGCLQEGVKKQLTIPLSTKTVFAEVVNPLANKELLRLCPHRELKGTDLTILYRAYFPNNGREGSIGISNTYIQLSNQINGTNLTEESLYEMALHSQVLTFNAVDFDTCTASDLLNYTPDMVESLKDALNEEDVPKDINDLFSREITLENLTKIIKKLRELSGSYIPAVLIRDDFLPFSTTALIHKELLDRISEKLKCNYYIAPVSMQELLVVAQIDGVDDYTVRDHIGILCSDENRERDYLSDNVYYYDKETKKLSII